MYRTGLLLPFIPVWVYSKSSTARGIFGLLQASRLHGVPTYDSCKKVVHRSCSLAADASCVCCRNSKLTMLLQDSLGGNAKALMIANLAPSPAHATETLSSLAFASKVLSQATVICDIVLKSWVLA